MQAKLITTFDSLSESDFLAKAGTIINALTANADYPEPWVAQVPTLANLISSYTSYLDCYHAAISHDSLKIALRNNARQALTLLFKQLIPYLEMMAQGDTSVLATSGFDLRKDIVHGGSGNILPAPTDFRVEHGAKRSSVNIYFARLTGAGSYEVQTSQGDPTIEANWHHVLSTVTSAHIVLEDQTPAQACWVRVRGIGSAGAGVWTDPVSLIVD